MSILFIDEAHMIVGAGATGQGNNMDMANMLKPALLKGTIKVVASTKKSKFTIIENSKKRIYGIQFHPEVTHTSNGKKIFSNFLFSIYKIKKKWRIES